MKSTGLVKKVDSVGRFILPVELRSLLDIENNDSIEIFVDNDSIVLKKHKPSCICCGSYDNLISFRKKQICKACVEELKNA